MISSGGDAETGRDENQNDAFDVTSAACEQQKNANHGQDDGQHEQKPFCRSGVGQKAWSRHHEASVGALVPFGSPESNVA